MPKQITRTGVYGVAMKEGKMVCRNQTILVWQSLVKGIFVKSRAKFQKTILHATLPDQDGLVTTSQTKMVWLHL